MAALSKDSKHFLELGDKRIPTKGTAMSWCPTMDVLAISLPDNKVSMHMRCADFTGDAVPFVVAKSVGDPP